MKNSVYLIILFALGLLFTSYKWISGATEKVSEPGGNSAIENIMSRTSVRSYTDRKVSREQVDTLLRAAMAAPTAGNKQPWRFVVIENRSTLEWIGDNFKSMSMAREAAVGVVVCGDVTATFPGDGRDYWIEDTSAAAENLLLAAHAMGLGAVWCGIYPMVERVEAFSDRLALPEEIIPMGCICIGYPAGETVPKDKWKPEYVHYNKWHTTQAPPEFVP